MDPPNKRQKTSDESDSNEQQLVEKQPTKISIELNAITTRICKSIIENNYSSYHSKGTFILGHELKKLRMENIIKIINTIAENTNVKELWISNQILNVFQINYILEKLLSNTSVKSLQFIHTSLNIDYFNNLETLISIPNKIEFLAIDNLKHNNDNNDNNDNNENNQPFINELIKIITKSSLIKISLKNNNFSLSQMIRIIQALPKTLKHLEITLEAEKNYLITQNIEIDSQLVLDFANAIQNTNIEVLNIQYHLFNFTQSCLIVEKLPQTLKKLTYIMNNNNYSNRESLQSMQPFSNLLYRNYSLTNINIYDNDYLRFTQAFPNNNLGHLLPQQKAVYDKVINFVNCNKMYIKTRNQVLVKRNLSFPVNKEAMINWILSTNKANAQYNTQFSYLPTEVLNIVYDFMNSKTVYDIKNEIYIDFIKKAKEIHEITLKNITESRDESVAFADRLAKRKLMERSITERNNATAKYNEGIQQLTEVHHKFLQEKNYLVMILKKSH